MTETTQPLREQIARAIRDVSAAKIRMDYGEMADAAIAILAAQPRPELGEIVDAIRAFEIAIRVPAGDTPDREYGALLTLIARLAAPPATREEMEAALNAYADLEVD